MRRWSIVPAVAFDSYRDLWDRLNQLNGDHPLLDSVFVECLIRHFGSDSTRLAVCPEPGHAGMALLEASRIGVWQTFQPSQAPLGLVLMADKPAHQEALALLGSLPGFALSLSVLQQDPDFTAFPEETVTPLVEHLPYIQTARLRVSGPFDSYWQSRGRNLVHNLSRQRRRLSDRGAALELVAERDPSCVREAIRSYGRLESNGWKAAEGTAVDEANTQGRFYIDVLERFCRRGEGVIYRLCLDGRTVAMDLCIERSGMLVILKTTYDEEVEGLSLGLLLHQDIFRAVFDDQRLGVIEFYGPVRDWHTKWTTEIRTMYHLTLLRHAWVPRARSLARAWARTVGRS